MSMKTPVEMGSIVSDVAEQGRAQGERAFERTMDGFKQSAAAATAGFEQAQAGLKDGVERMMRSTEQFLAFGRGNVEAWLRSSQVLAAGMQDMGRHLASQTQEQLDEALVAFRQVSGVKSLKEAIELQSGFARSAVEKAVSNTTRFTEQTVKLAEDVTAPLAARVSAAAEILVPRG
jgi:phasin family protein